MKPFNLKKLLINIGISVGTGLLAAFLTRNSMAIYQTFEKPPLAPPAWVFPVVWTILYTLMGVSAYRISQSDANEADKERALSIYGFQLLFNFLWSIVFFNFNSFLIAFIVILALWSMIIAMIITFRKIDPLAGNLQIPYLLWVTFAAYLNLAIYLLNRTPA